MEKKKVRHKLSCNNCSKPFNMHSFVIREARIVRDLDFSSTGAYCSDCFHEACKSIKEKRFVEEYKGEAIYMKDGRYAPYWGASYAFDNIDDCKKRMEMKGIAVTPFGMMDI
ncbi:hypothetical protein ACWN8V_06960 [Vagococcus elongatus]|uniref:Uncharacterized protein n=1 Tax=Vagococcus elongatus TaxID=180344 RepID=A0A430AW33_9ENTE|nr:hypothetical protein [Vagococcus elongatus]RSU12274.1 hypothetical protein CBF29_06650 [Vagococcus elongatus]